MQPDEHLRDEEANQRFQSIVGSSTYPRQAPSNEISYAVRQLSRATYTPSKVHMGATKRLTWYLAGTLAFSITFKQVGFRLHVYWDANWGSDLDTKKSTHAHIVEMCNGPVTFKGDVQRLRAQSTMEAEFVAGVLAARESVFLPESDAWAGRQGGL